MKIIKYKKYDYWNCLIFFNSYVLRWGFGKFVKEDKI